MMRKLLNQVCIISVICLGLTGCWPAPYNQTWEGRIVDPSGSPIEGAVPIMEYAKQCGSLGGPVNPTIGIKIGRTDSDGHFKLSARGVIVDYFYLIGGCIGTTTSKMICSNGKWMSADSMFLKEQVNNPAYQKGTIVFDSLTAFSDKRYGTDDLPEEIQKLCHSGK